MTDQQSSLPTSLFRGSSWNHHRRLMAIALDANRSDLDRSIAFFITGRCGADDEVESFFRQLRASDEPTTAFEDLYEEIYDLWDEFMGQVLLFGKAPDNLRSYLENFGFVAAALEIATNDLGLDL